MIILLGSESVQKKEVLRSALWELVADGLEVVPFPAASSVLEQPLDPEMTIRGSRNRALDAAARYDGDYDFSFGMEGGLQLEGDVYHLVCAVTVLDRSGRMETGISLPRPLPLEVSWRISEGAPFSRSMRDYAARIRESRERAQVSELMNRSRPFAEAIREAWRKLKSEV
jgi:non-canonical (house-cleaning) NTP pyrophosphatase